VNSWYNFSEIESFAKPFPHFVSSVALADEIGQSTLDWLESTPPWKLVETDFYEQYEFSFWDVTLPSAISILKDQSFLAAIKNQMEQQFNVRLSQSFDFTAHKLILGQTIRIHNDFIPGHETHRLLIQLNRKWCDRDGGYLLFFDGPRAEDVSKVFQPTHNSAIGFEISRESNHAVSTVHSGERFTLVLSFYAETDGKECCRLT
jgi:hypothetical protein